MEDKFYKTNFEQFLKDTTDDFLMVPSRKVWYSIYNNLHPDKKWPSMAVCLLILSAVLYIGVSNNNSLSDAARRASIDDLSEIAKNYASEINADVEVNTKHISHNISTPAYNLKNTSVNNNIFSKPEDKPSLSKLLNVEKYPEMNTEVIPSSAVVYRTNVIPSAKNLSTTPTNENAGVENNSVSTRRRIYVKSKKGVDDYSDAGDKADPQPNVVFAETAGDNNKKLPAATKTILNTTADIEKSWRENYAFKNKPELNKFKERASITYFITPSIGYRSSLKTAESTISEPLPVPSAFRPAAVLPFIVTNDPLKDGRALNLEVGTVLNYAVSENVRLKSGIQANYTNYVSFITSLGHPTQAELAVNTSGNRFRSSYYSSQPGEEHLNRSSLQVSVPLGADLKIAGNRKIKWYLGALLQPTYVFAGSAFVLSADEKYYISERPLLRKWNMNSAVETFISFKTSSAVTINVGPQFRYQLLSSFKNEYNYSEKLYNLGLKIGVSTHF